MHWQTVLPPKESRSSRSRGGLAMMSFGRTPRSRTFAEIELDSAPPPEVVSPTPFYPKAFLADLWSQPPHPAESILPAPPTPRLSRPGNSRRKKRMLITLGVLFVVLAAVGGAVGGVLGNRRHGNDGATTTDEPPGSGYSPTSAGVENPATRTDTAPTTSGTPSPPRPSPLVVAAAISPAGTNGEVNIQVFYQREGSATVKYRVCVWGQKYGAAYDLQLSIPPRRGSLAATSRADGAGNTLVQLFYMLDVGADETHIVLAQLTCAKGAANCVETESNVISSPTKNPVDRRSSVAAVWLDGKHTARVFYQAAGGYIAEMNGDPAEGSGFRQNWDSHVLEGTEAVPGSSLAVAAAATSGTDIAVFYAAVGSGRLHQVLFDGGWKVPVPVDGSVSPPGWNSSAVLTACYESTRKTWHAYYVAPATGQMIEYARAGNTQSWTRFGTATAWTAADSGVAAVGWSDQVRLLYLTKGNVVQSAQSNGMWSSSLAIAD